MVKPLNVINEDELMDMACQPIRYVVQNTLSQGLTTLPCVMALSLRCKMAKPEQMLATINDIDEETLRRLHIRCVNDVKKIHGALAVKFQRGESIRTLANRKAGISLLFPS